MVPIIGAFSWVGISSVDQLEGHDVKEATKCRKGRLAGFHDFIPAHRLSICVAETLCKVYAK